MAINEIIAIKAKITNTDVDVAVAFFELNVVNNLYFRLSICCFAVVVVFIVEVGEDGDLGIGRLEPNPKPKIGLFKGEGGLIFSKHITGTKSTPCSSSQWNGFKSA